MNQQADPAVIHARRFLFWMALVILAGAATVAHLIGIWHGVWFVVGSITVLAYAWVAPTYEPPETDTAEPDPDRGFN